MYSLLSFLFETAIIDIILPIIAIAAIGMIILPIFNYLFWYDVSDEV
jgi:hypothetical protein